MLLSVEQLAPIFVDPHHEPWHSSLFQLSFSGKVPFYDSINSIKVRGQTASVIYGGNNQIKIDFMEQKNHKK